MTKKLYNKKWLFFGKEFYMDTVELSTWFSMKRKKRP